MLEHFDSAEWLRETCRRLDRVRRSENMVTGQLRKENREIVSRETELRQRLEASEAEIEAARPAGAHERVEIGSEAPDFTLRDENGEELTLSSLRGRNVVLVFYPAAFSSICTRELHDISKARDSYDAAGAEVIGISIDSHHALKAFKRDEEIEARLVSASTRREPWRGSTAHTSSRQASRHARPS